MVLGAPVWNTPMKPSTSQMGHARAVRLRLHCQPNTGRCPKTWCSSIYRRCRRSEWSAWTESLLYALVLGGAGTLLAMDTARAAGCQLGRLAEVAITMNGLRPTIVAGINGTPTTFIVDSGAFYSSLSPAKAAELKLPVSPAPYDLRMSGIGGSAAASISRVKELTIFNVRLTG